MILSIVPCAIFVACSDHPHRETTEEEALLGRPALALQSPTEVCWETSGWDAEKDIVRRAVASTWEAVSGVSMQFVGWRTCTGGGRALRIRISDERVHCADFGVNNLGRPGGVTLNFSYSQWYQQCASPARRTNCIALDAIHEFGHALGFSHEQNRSDIPPSSGCTPALIEEGAGDVLSSDYSTFNTMWDRDSIMNYCNPRYANRGTDAPIYGVTGWRLSTGDTVGMRAMYGGADLVGHGGARCTSGDGLYCGGNGVEGDLNTLYECANGRVRIRESCHSGCQRHPAGEADACR